MNAQHIDKLRSIEYQESYLVKLQTVTQYTIDAFIVLNTHTDKIKELLNTYDECMFVYDEGDGVILTVKRQLTETELIKQIESIEGNLNYHYNKVSKWCDNNQETRQLLNNYMSKYNIKLNRKI